MVTERRCTKCGEVKPKSEFSKRSKSENRLRHQCKACCSINHKEWRRTHQQETVAYDKEYQRDHREDLEAKRKIYKKTHRAMLREADRKYRAAHHVERWAKYHIWRARKIGATIELFDLQDVLDYWGPMCAYCGSTEDLTLDHIVPLAQGMTHSSGNLCVACRPCNGSKGAKELSEWIWQRFPRPELAVAL